MSSTSFAILARSPIFGSASRYRMERIRDRFGSLVWFVFDAETPDPTGDEYTPGIVRQESDLSAALRGLDINAADTARIERWAAGEREAFAALVRR